MGRSHCRRHFEVENQTQRTEVPWPSCFLRWQWQSGTFPSTSLSSPEASSTSWACPDRGGDCHEGQKPSPALCRVGFSPIHHYSLATEPKKILSLLKGFGPTFDCGVESDDRCRSYFWDSRHNILLGVFSALSGTSKHARGGKTGTSDTMLQVESD